IAATARDEFHRALDELPAGILRSETDVQIDVRRVPALAADQLVDGHSGLAAFDVPERIAEAGDGAIEDGVVLVIGAHVTELPDLLDPVGGPTGHQRLQVLLDGRLDELRTSARKRGRRAS